MKLSKQLSIYISLLVLMVLTVPVRADIVIPQRDIIMDIDTRYEIYNVDYQIGDDYRITKNDEYFIKALTESGVNKLRSYTLEYLNDVQQFAVIDARIIKKTGEQINLRDEQVLFSPVQSPLSNKPILTTKMQVNFDFEQLEVGDGIYLRTSQADKVALFDQHFSLEQKFHANAGYKDVHMTVTLPRDMNYYTQLNDVNATTEQINGAHRINIHYSNYSPFESERNDFSIANSNTEVGIMISSFINYEKYVAAFSQQLQKPTSLDKQVVDLAQRITAQTSDKKLQAKLLYNWVSDNIDYVADNCLTLGGFTPRPTTEIIDSGYGDCKDHASLYEDLLQAKNITSHMVLVHDGNFYSLPHTPVASAFNHVITYLPEWQIFVDSTNDIMPFELLAKNLTSKPVLVSNYKQDFKYTPLPHHRDNGQRLRFTGRISEQGDLSGTFYFEHHGYNAIDARQIHRQLTTEQQVQRFADLLSWGDSKGEVSKLTNDPSPREATYVYKFEYKKQGFVDLNQNGYIDYAPLWERLSNLEDLLYFPDQEVVTNYLSCINGMLDDTLILILPENIEVEEFPTQVIINEHNIFYGTLYTHRARFIEVNRRFKNTGPANNCAAKMVNMQREFVPIIEQNRAIPLNYQVTSGSEK